MSVVQRPCVCPCAQCNGTSVQTVQQKCASVRIGAWQWQRNECMPPECNCVPTLQLTATHVLPLQPTRGEEEAAAAAAAAGRAGGCAQDVRLRSALVLHGRRVDKDRIQLNRRDGGVLLRKTTRFSQRFLCLSRACLGKMIGCSKVARQKAFFAPPDRSARRARPECTRTCSDHNRTVA
jgi:hypothetical protein